MLKLSELGAMNALLNAASIHVQRIFRGYLGYILTIRRRMEMAQFIALMRAQEAKGDEDLYWETHPWQRFKRDQKEWMEKKLLKAYERNALGGARLNAADEAEVQDKDLDDEDVADNSSLDDDNDDDFEDDDDGVGTDET